MKPAGPGLQKLGRTLKHHRNENQVEMLAGLRLAFAHRFDSRSTIYGA